MSSPPRHSPNREWHTPQIARIKALKEDSGLTFRQIADITSIPKSTVWKRYETASANQTTRRAGHHPNREQKRGRKPLISQEQIWEMERILESDRIETRAMTWEHLAYEAGLDCSGHTVQRAMGTLDYHKCIACQKGWISERIKKLRIQYAETMLEKYPKAEDWSHIRFSDECHFGYGSEGSYRIIRKPGERYCQKCIQEANPKGEPEEKDQKRVHCWAAIGHDFKSSLFWYDVPTNKNGKLTHKAYLEQVLEPAVKPWLEEAKSGKIDPFVLEEDNDSSHKGGIITTWKRQNKLDHYFNCPRSPDLAPIENA